MLMDYMPSILALLFIQVVGLISSGPDFAVVVRNSLIYSRKTGVLTAVGVAFGILIHITYILLGFGVLVSKTVWLFHLFKYLGAGYLLYIGSKGLRARKKAVEYGDLHHRKDISSLRALHTGFLANVLNAKCMLFFISIISAFLTPSVPGMVVFIYGAILFLSTLFWFLIVAFCFSNKHLRKTFNNYNHWIERVTGGMLMLLGIKMLFVDVAIVE